MREEKKKRFAFFFLASTHHPTVRETTDAIQNKNSHSSNSSNTHRFLWAFVCTGVYLFVTSAVGLSGAECAPRRRCGVSAHVYMLSVAVLAQLAVALALFLETGARGENDLADLDITGAEAKLARAVRKHTPLARGVALAIFAAQIADLALATALANADAPRAGDGEEEEEEEDSERAFPRLPPKRAWRSLRVWEFGGRDDDGAETEEAERGGSLRGGRARRGGDARGAATEKNPLGAPLLDRADDDDDGEHYGEPLDGAFSDAESESAVWARRMRSKYNLDVTRLAYDPERAARRAEPGRAGEAGGKCVVM